MIFGNLPTSSGGSNHFHHASQWKLVFEDNFTDADFTYINDHTPDPGPSPGFLEVNALAQIIGNSFAADDVQTYGFAIRNIGLRKPNKIEVGFTGAGNYIGIRAQNFPNYLYWLYESSTLRFYERSSSGNVLLHTLGHSIGVSPYKTIVCTDYGDLIRLTLTGGGKSYNTEYNTTSYNKDSNIVIGGRDSNSRIDYIKVYKK